MEPVSALHAGGPQGCPGVRGVRRDGASRRPDLPGDDRQVRVGLARACGPRCAHVGPPRQRPRQPTQGSDVSGGVRSRGSAPHASPRLAIPPAGNHGVRRTSPLLPTAPCRGLEAARRGYQRTPWRVPHGFRESGVEFPAHEGDSREVQEEQTRLYGPHLLVGGRRRGRHRKRESRKGRQPCLHCPRRRRQSVARLDRGLQLEASRRHFR
mmetsp:Transcript_34581/g.81924  ORF Transcript_34581/g.81924 Transcript_34581/m.81924 type:complete len:210 (-) Transcript_34581:152-781(-)